MAASPVGAAVAVFAVVTVAAADDGNAVGGGFTQSCSRTLAEPLTRLWGTRPHPDLSMVSPTALWPVTDPNLAILPRWRPTRAGAGFTAPFVDTHVAVRFLGGVSPRSPATAPNCTDRPGPPPKTGVDVPGVWCDLAVRDGATGAVTTRFDLVRSRLDRYVDAGIDVMIVLDNVPWAFVNVTSEGACKNFGCQVRYRMPAFWHVAPSSLDFVHLTLPAAPGAPEQYLPPDNPAEFATWVGELAAFVLREYGDAFASRVRWRLGTEANGPRWSNHGKYFERYWDCYRLVASELRKVLSPVGGGQVGASNWVEVVGRSGNLTRNGSDWFAHDFYAKVAAAEEEKVPLDWVSVSHYGTGRRNAAPGTEDSNFPGGDWVQRTPGGGTGRMVELEAMRRLANRPNASLEVQEWSILTNERQQPTWEPSGLGTAWTAASEAAWVCAGVDRIFHWETGTSLRNSSGNNRIVNFFEQWPWNMALLELFIGGRATFSTYARSAAPRGSVGGDTVAVIESERPGHYMALVAAVAATRTGRWTTDVSLKTSAFKAALGAEAPVGARVRVEQYKMNSTFSVVETIIRELSAPGHPGTLLHADGLPYDFGRLLTPAGVAYAERPENLERYWAQHAATFRPSAYEGSWRHLGDGSTMFTLDASAASVTVISATLD